MQSTGRLVLRRLKDETAELHREAETHVRILDPDATLDAYRAYLGVMLGFHAPLEARLARHPGLAALGFEGPGRSKRALLEADLAALGEAAGAWPACAALPDTTGLAAALGAAYVLEGSTLGGRYILAKLPPPLVEVKGRATAFLTGYGAATGAQWRAFGEVVERAADGPGLGGLGAALADGAVAGARATFTHLIAWFAAHPGRRAAALAEAS